jgi:tetratricopeptide (TPR) repeat protein
MNQLVRDLRLESLASTPLTVRARPPLSPAAMKRTLLALILALVATAPALAQTADETNCVGDDPQTKLAACSAVIEAGQEDPGNQAVAYDNRSIANREQGLLDPAIADASKAIELDPTSVPAYLDRGIAHYAKKQFALAIIDFTKVIALKPDYVAAYNDRGNAYDDSGDHDHAITDYSHALVLKPDYADAFVNRGSAYEEKGFNDYAISDYRSALKLDPNLKPAQAGLKRLGGAP